MIKQYQLKNGMQVILLSSRKSPVVSIQAWVKTGSVDEGNREKGVTHFLEHLVFKGTKDFAVGEIAGAVEACGGEINAYTSFEQTVYHVTMPRHEMKTGLRVISNMVGYPTLDAGEIDNERGVVIEEIKKGRDSLGRVAGQQLFSAAFPKHPLGVPVIGYDSVIEKIKPEEIRRYHQQHYHTKNVFLVIAGDFEAKDIRGEIEESFGRIPGSTPKKRAKTKIKVLKRPTKALLSTQATKFQQNIMYQSWRAPAPSHKDVPALDLLAALLGQGDSSRLVKRLRLEKAATLSVGSSLFYTREQGLFLISSVFSEENFSEVQAGMSEVLEKVWSESLPENEIKKAVNGILSDEAYSMETVDGLARRFGSAYFYLQDLSAEKLYKKRLLAVTPHELNRVARKYLEPKTMILSLTTANGVKIPSVSIKKWQSELQKIFLSTKKVRLPALAQKKLKHAKWILPSKGFAGEVETLTLPSGDRILLRRDTSTPVISAKLVFLGGLRLQPENIGGATELVSRVWTSGARELSEEQLSLRLDEMASQVSAVGGRNSWGLSLDTLASFQEQTLDIFGKLLLEPSFDESIVRREAEVMIHQLKTRKDNPGQICGINFIKQIFNGHPCSQDFYGSEPSLKELTGDRLKALVAGHLHQHARHFVVCGNFDPKLWKKELAAFSQQLPQSRYRHGEWVNLPSATTGSATKDSLVFHELDKEQTHLILGWKGLKLNDSDRYALHILQSILAGQGGRLFIELRDKKSLAYSVAPMRMEGIDGGYFGAYIACSPEKLETAIEGIRTEFRRLIDTAVPDAEIARSKRYLEGRHDIDLQRNSALANGFIYNDVYGLDPLEVFSYRERMESISAKELQELARRLFSSEPTLSVVGKRPPRRN